MDFKSKNHKNGMDLTVYFIYGRKILHKMEEYGGKWQSNKEILLYR